MPKSGPQCVESARLSPRLSVPAVTLLFCLVCLVPASPALAASSWIKFSDVDKHILEIDDAAWGFLYESGTDNLIDHAHVNEGAADPGVGVDSWEVDNQTVAPVVVTTPVGSTQVPAGTSRVFLETDFDFAVDYTGITPGATDTLVMVSRDSRQGGLEIHRFEYDLAGQTYGVPAVLVTLQNPVSGMPMELTAGHVWQINASNPVGRVMSMGITVRQLPMSSPGSLVVLVALLLGVGGWAKRGRRRPGIRASGG